ncbi:MAG: sn-glycerol-1-phosphate dehydrogenase [Clostridia bacterium]|nr:sn-glycerol-1-phosphate dehydrogenase [Clostridia bacterium]
MDFTKMLAGKKDCACGREHLCPIKGVSIGNGAIADLSEYARDYKNILVVCDQNTLKVGGEQVKEILGDKVYDVLVYNSEGFLVPDEVAIEEMENKLKENTDLIVGIGSGVINDLCKYVSFKRDLPYHIVATAPSMDGYASNGAALIIKNMKVTYSARVPEVIIGDTSMLKDAPMDMIKAGYGDIMGKFSCLNDWKLSKLVNDEYICEYVYDLTYDIVKKTKPLAKKLLERDEESIKTLMEALVVVGIAMAYIGTSRPASGSEHHLSHFFEITGIIDDEPYFCHGTDVAYSMLAVQQLRDEIIKMDSPVTKAFDESDWEANVKRVYKKAADGIIEYQKKLGMIYEDKSQVYAQKWNEIKEVLKEVPSVEETTEMLETVGLPVEDFYKMYSKEKLADAVKYAKDLKDRYTVLWLYNSLK